MSKKKKGIIVLSIVCTVALAFVGGQTFSKYVTEVKGEGVAEIATWSFKVNGQTEQVQEIKLASTYDNETLVGNKIAPGTTGSFKILVDATGSDVGIDYKIEFSDESTKPTNLKFVYDGTEYDSILELGNTLSGRINADDANKEKTFEIEWKWDYETGTTDVEKANNDKLDTTEAQSMANYTFDVTVSGTQVVPQV